MSGIDEIGFTQVEAVDGITLHKEIACGQLCLSGVYAPDSRFVQVEKARIPLAEQGIVQSRDHRE